MLTSIKNKVHFLSGFNVFCCGAVNSALAFLELAECIGSAFRESVAMVRGTTNSRHRLELALYPKTLLNSQHSAARRRNNG